MNDPRGYVILIEPTNDGGYGAWAPDLPVGTLPETLRDTCRRVETHVDAHVPYWGSTHCGRWGSTMTETLVELDERRRLSLGKVGRPEHRRYLAHEEANGTIILVPAVVMPESEARLLANHELVEQIEHTLDDPANRVRRGRPTRKG